ncbi:MAG: nucleoside-diphosphate kinase [Bacteroidales bacterium]|jgi:nucleoside-diphosphate kinase|nr:nucleoside-diphosphate kinase [Bacteroidales bacterium]
MSNDITFSIIKPDALGRGDAARILCRIAEAGFTIAALKMLHMTRTEAEGFYDVHRERPFFPGLVEFMSSGPVIVMVLRHNDAIEEFRHLIGTTDPAKASPGTIRAEFGTDVKMNAVHGSDSPENALREASYFFSAIEIF